MTLRKKNSILTETDDAAIAATGKVTKIVATPPLSKPEIGE